MPGAAANLLARVGKTFTAHRLRRVPAADAGTWKTAASGRRAPGMVSGPAFGSRGLHRVPCTPYVSWRESSRDEKEAAMAKQGGGGKQGAGWPSKNKGKPSGGGRDNNPPKKK